MTAINPAIFFSALLHPAATWRRAHGSFVRPGVVPSTSGLLVAQHAGTPNMSVDVAEGFVNVLGSESTYQGTYICETQGVTTVTISAADPTNPRRDLIIARVRDADYTGAANTLAIEVVTGTAAASPVDPALPAGSVWVLARVRVAAAATSILNAVIDDIRFGAAGYTSQNGAGVAVGGLVPCTSTSRPTTGLYVGLAVWETDTKVISVYNGATWDSLPGAPGAWTAPTLLNSWTNFGSGYQTARYRKIGDIVYLEGLITGGTIGTGAGSTIMTLPAGFRPVSQQTWATMSNSAFGRINVLNTGAVNCEIGNNAYVWVGGMFSTI